MRLSELGEDGLLAELERRGLVEAIADDGAELEGGLVVTQDLLLEGIHFRLEWTPLRDLGYKAAAVNLSDLAALGARPSALLVSLGLPPDADPRGIVELYEGLNEPGVPVVGGDTSRAGALLVAVTALGRSARVPGRSGACPGDVLVVTGPLGGAAGGLYALRHGLEGFEALVERHRRPPLRLVEGRRLAASAHALMDLSDGIATDAARLAARSGVRVVVDVDRLPLAAGLPDADEPFWTQGEDYELLAALAPGDPLAVEHVVVGRCEPGEGVELRRNGEPVQALGWDHFGA